MTKLEFIDKYIELLKTKIESSKESARIYYANDDYEFGKMEEENRVGYEEELEMFQQIKQDLEAWEESKKYFILNEGCVPFYESTYEYITLKNDCIDESNSEEEGISIIKIKKALEKENVKNKR